MRVKCMMCGKEEELSKLHKDYKKLAANPAAAFICKTCSLKVTNQAQKGNDVLKKK